MCKSNFLLVLFLCELAPLFCCVSFAQDSRVVTEPVLPTAAQICSKVDATKIKNASNDLDAETSPDTVAIQSAVNACEALLLLGGTETVGAVELELGSNWDGAPYNAFLSGPITLPSNVVLLIDTGVTVFASRNPRDYDLNSGSCGIVATSSAGCKPLISADSTVNSGIMGLGVIDGRGEDRLDDSSCNAPMNTCPTWWNLSTTAKHLGQRQYNPILVHMASANNFTAYETTFQNAPLGHLYYSGGSGYTVWGITIDTPGGVAMDQYGQTTGIAKNTDGLDIGNAQNVTVEASTLNDGDDNIAIGASHGGQSTTNISIINNHVFKGHGVSIGSITQQGISNVLVDTISFSGDISNTEDTALNIKSAADRGGVVQNILYNNVCVQNVWRAIQFDPFYTSTVSSPPLYPQFQSVQIHNFHYVTSGRTREVRLQGYNSSYPLGLTLDNIVFDPSMLVSSAVTLYAPEYANVSLGPNPVDSTLVTNLSGTGVTVTNDVTNSPSAYDCTGKFGTAPPIP